MTIHPRPYQTETLQDARKAYRAGHRRVILQASTGAGKTVMATLVCRNATATGQRVLYVVHRDAILRQTKRALTAAGVTVTTLQAGGTATPIEPGTVLLASAQTLARRTVPDFDFGVWDEAHTFYTLQQRVQGPRRWLLLTATPSLTSGAPLSAIADAIVTGPADDFLTAAGYLVPLEVYGAPSPDLHGVTRQRGDYRPGQLQAAHQAPKLVGAAGASMARHGRDGARWLRAIVYCAGIEHSRQVTAELVALGCRAVHIDGETPPEVRAQLYADLAAQRIDALVNYGVAIEGLDIPEIECIAAFRAMGSLSDFLQSLGRGRRPSAGKARLIYIDGGGNCYRHGWPTVARQWTLAGKVPAVAAPGLQTCKACLAIYEPAPTCPRCGAVAEVKPRRGPQTVGAELVRLTAATVVSKKQIAEWTRQASQWCPARPVPSWAAADEGLWRGLERTRQREGHSLGDGTQAHPGWTAVQWRRIRNA